MENENFKIISDGKFLSHGKVTPLLKENIKTSLNALENIVDSILKIKKCNPVSFGIRDAYVVGSVLKGSSKSDVDVYFRTEGTDQGTNNILKEYMFYTLCEGKNKNDWIDAYFGTEIPNTSGVFLGYPKYRITRQIEDELKEYNESIGAPKIKLGH